MKILVTWDASVQRFEFFLRSGFGQFIVIEETRQSVCAYVGGWSSSHGA